MKAEDLVHGGIYRLKGRPELIGQLDLSLSRRRITINGDSPALFMMGAWEPVPLTPEVLTENLGFSHELEINSITLLLIRRPLRFIKFDVGSGIWYYCKGIKEISLDSIDHVHDVQRLYLALTGNPLEWRAGS